LEIIKVKVIGDLKPNFFLFGRRKKKKPAQWVELAYKFCPS
jgi:hypothetical protein